MMKRIIKKILFHLLHPRLRVRIMGSISLQSIFEGNNSIGKNSVFVGKMGYCSYIGDNSRVFGIVGKYTSIGHNVSVVRGTHPVRDFISTCPVFFSKQRTRLVTYTDKQCFDEYHYADETNKYSVIIENDVWIGYGVSIMEGVTVHNGAVVAAGALVTHDVMPYEIVAGIPAKVIGTRFDSETVNKLLMFKWWDKPEAWLIEHCKDFGEVELFKKKYLEDIN